MTARSTTAPPRGHGATPSRDRADHELPTTPALWSPVLALVGGLLAWLAFPPYDLWYLLPVALAMLGGAVLVRRRIVAALAGLIWGVAFFLPLMAWANTYAGFAPWFALAAFEAMYVVVFALAARTVMRRRGITIGSALIVACLWAGTELLRSHLPWGGLPWGIAAFSLQSSPLLNLGPWIGTVGLGAVVALLGQAVLGGTLAVLGRRPAREGRLRGVWSFSAAVAVVLACLVVPLPLQKVPDGSTMRIAGIQGNVPPIDTQDLVMPEEIFPNSLELTAQAAADARTDGAPLDLVVWPEGSVGWDPREDRPRSAALTAAARDAEAPVLIGTQTDAPHDERYNMSMLWTADGTVSQTSAKRHPVPFGEYIPYRGFFRQLSDKVDLVPVDMAAGTEVGIMDVGGRKVGVLICFEIAYENLVHDVVDDGAEVIVVQTNTALFGESDEAVQQLAEARVLSVVSGRSIVQVATVGESAIVTPDGRVIAHAGHWEPGTVTADVPLYSGITPAVAAGPWIGVGIGALAVAGLVLALVRPASALPAAPSRTRRTS
ncbi:apolipoprotein N-acyltransferase [Brachybacterium sp. AOP25-B2-12]|uniref:apolipoprotein N-acyltransferase n=1 Tax=Brachybacterium sp. AOP25-B2-12 TaxID=3457710 RepID=UPI004034B52D